MGCVVLGYIYVERLVCSDVSGWSACKRPKALALFALDDVCIRSESRCPVSLFPSAVRAADPALIL